MTPYYQDDTVALYCGDSLEVLPTLDNGADVLLTDPPYFRVKQDAWDNQWSKSHKFLAWMGEWMDLTKPLMAPHASVWVFASPAMMNSVERLVSERFHVLNSIRWAKIGGDNLRRVSMPTMRQFVSIWEGIVFAEMGKDDVKVFEPIGRYLRNEREKAGLTRPQMAAGLEGYKNFDSANANMRNWESGRNLIGETDYVSLRYRAGGEWFPRDYKDVRREGSALREAYEATRRPFYIEDRKLSEDIWHFSSVHHHPGKHPCEKPQDMLTHMIETSSRPGWTILDPFAGSGSTLIAARNTGRKAIGIEKDEAWCEKIAQRLSENTLNIGEAA